jgi:hypothetical protein
MWILFSGGSKVKLVTPTRHNKLARRPLPDHKLDASTDERLALSAGSYFCHLNRRGWLLVPVKQGLLDVDAVRTESPESALVVLVAIQPTTGYPHAVGKSPFVDGCNPKRFDRVPLRLTETRNPLPAPKNSSLPSAITSPYPAFASVSKI